MTKHIGIVACSAEGAALCYRTICAESAAVLGAHRHPEISMHTFALADYVPLLNDGNLQGVAELMLGSVRKLAVIGADFAICPDNTIHRAMTLVQASSPIPWLHIADVVAREAQTHGFRKLGLTGTKWLVESEVYPEALRKCGLEFERPDQADRTEINRIIMDELVYGRIEPGSTRFFQAVIGRMQASGCDGVVLGCTEIPLMISDTNSVLPVLDSTRLLARAAIRHATA